MSVKKYNASITYDTDNKHPDVKNAKGLVFDDSYIIDTSIFGGDIHSFIRHDLALVAGGGYDTEHITNVVYWIEQV